MASPNNTPIANFGVLQAKPAIYGWQVAGLDDANPIKLVYFDNVAWLKNPPRWAGHVGLLSQGTIYSDSNYALSPWWRSKFARAFVPVFSGPRLIVVRRGGLYQQADGNSYKDIASDWTAGANVLNVHTADLQEFLGASVAGLPATMPIRDTLIALGFPNARFDLTHMEDPANPRVYVFT
jgi:hypothetical protein